MVATERTPSTSHGSLVGPTAVGKSTIASAYAQRAGDVEIVSVDSMGVYRGMDIGTAKATPADRHAVAHHLVDIVDPHEEFSVSQFQDAARRAIGDVEARGNRALLVGGTALYLRAVVDDLTIPGRYPEVRAELDAQPDTEALHRRLTELDPLAASRMEPSNRRRVVRALEVTIGADRPFSSFGPGLDAYPPCRFTLVGLAMDRDLLDERIRRRYHCQIEAGFLAEVERLRQCPEGLSRTASEALGYRELLEHLEGATSLDEALERAVARTRRFARRQERWLRRDPRITWVQVGPEPLDSLDEVAAALEGVALEAR